MSTYETTLKKTLRFKGRRAAVRSWADVARVREKVERAMRAEGYGDGDVFAVSLALEEALSNAVKHGHGGDPSKAVRVRYRVAADRVLLHVADQGPGFDPLAIPDPRSPENLERDSGRGLLLMQAYMTRLRFNRRGNALTMSKRRSAT
jgi:serine/threonine-protein kinase RsbW